MNYLTTSSLIVEINIYICLATKILYIFWREFCLLKTSEAGFEPAISALGEPRLTIGPPGLKKS